MRSVGVHEAKTHLSALLRQVATGEEIEITRGNIPIARLVPAPASGTRQLGVDVRRFAVPDDFDAPLPDEVLDVFER